MQTNKTSKFEYTYYLLYTICLGHFKSNYLSLCWQTTADFILKSHTNNQITEIVFKLNTITLASVSGLSILDCSFGRILQFKNSFKKIYILLYLAYQMFYFILTDAREW
jgi:hypothetical protein